MKDVLGKDFSGYPFVLNAIPDSSGHVWCSHTRKGGGRGAGGDWVVAKGVHNAARPHADLSSRLGYCHCG